MKKTRDCLAVRTVPCRDGMVKGGEDSLTKLSSVICHDGRKCTPNAYSKHLSDVRETAMAAANISPPPATPSPEVMYSSK